MRGVEGSSLGRVNLRQEAMEWVGEETYHDIHILAPQISSNPLFYVSPFHSSNSLCYDPFKKGIF